MSTTCWNKSIGCLIIGFYLSLIFGLSGICVAGQDKPVKRPAEIAWEEFDGEDYDIYYSNFDGSSWTPKIKLSHNSYADIYPSISSGADGRIWVVWTTLIGTEVHLSYSNFDGGSWSYSKQISTSLSSNTAPSIIVDKSNIPWIVWAGFDGQDDEIFFIFFYGYEWDAPSRVNKDDSMPDILPVIGIDSFVKPYVVWSGYDGERYKNYSSKWTGSEWADEIESHKNDLYRSMIKNAINIVPDLPEYIDDPDKVSIHIKNAGQIQSIRFCDVKK